MKYRILSFEVGGIKNLIESVSLSFSRVSIRGRAHLEEGKIKSIYGGNGSGKTAILLGLWIAREVATKRNFVLDGKNKQDLMNLINKKTGEFEASVVFETLSDDEVLMDILKYSISLKIDRDDIRIVKENLGILKNKANLANPFRNIFTVENGVLLEEPHIESGEELKESTKNLLPFSSFLSEAFYQIASKNPNEQAKGPIIDTLFFLAHLKFYFCKEDTERIAPSYSDIEKLRENVLKLTPETYDPGIFSSERDIVPKKWIGEYKKHLSNLSVFLNLFNSDIKGIDADCKENGKIFVCNKYVEYEGYKIDSSYESAGLKKLIHLFSSLRFATNGGVVLVDELDTNISTVYLSKFLSFFMSYGEGQLVFTAHNLKPLDVLEGKLFPGDKPMKHSIDFLNNEHKIIPWVRNGHYKASLNYFDGAIEGSPFNIEPGDFVSCFFRVEEEADK